MKEIKVVGDIRYGKYQPALTGNPIVDSALIDQFCQQLSDWLAQHDLAFNVSAEHAFSVSAASDTDVLYIIDKQILQAFEIHDLHQIHVVAVEHQALLHADPQSYYDTIEKALKDLTISKLS